MSPYEALLGVVVEGDDVVLAPRPALSNRGGRLHGGAIASLHAITAERAARDPLAELMLLYVAPPTDGPVRTSARVLRRGGLVQVESTIVDGASATVASALTLHGGGPAPATAAAAPPSRSASVASDAATDALPDGTGAVVVAASAFAATLGIAVVQRERARGVAVLPWRDVLAGADGRLHPGALATLVDTASGAAVWTEAGLGAGGRAATVAMHLAIQQRASGEDVVAEAHASAQFADLVTATLRLWTRGSGRLVAVASARYRVVPAA